MLFDRVCEKCRKSFQSVKCNRIICYHCEHELAEVEALKADEEALFYAELEEERVGWSGKDE